MSDSFNDGVKAAAEAVWRLGAEYEGEGSPTAKMVLDYGADRILALIRPEPPQLPAKP